jgi:hypothetical protein
VPAPRSRHERGGHRQPVGTARYRAGRTPLLKGCIVRVPRRPAPFDGKQESRRAPLLVLGVSYFAAVMRLPAEDSVALARPATNGGVAIMRAC